MFIGHSAPAFLIKLLLPHTDLGALVLGCNLADILGFSFATVGIETFRFNNSKVGALPYDFLNPYSHSLLGMALFGVVYTLFYLIITMNNNIKNQTFIHRFIGIELCVILHWLFEIPVHRIILDGVPLVPNGAIKFGYSLFDYQITENILELSLFITAALIYKYSTSSSKTLAWYQDINSYIVICTIIQLFVCAAPRFVYAYTPNKVMSAQSVVIYLVVSWLAHQVDKLRRVNTTTVKFD